MRNKMHTPMILTNALCKNFHKVSFPKSDHIMDLHNITVSQQQM